MWASVPAATPALRDFVGVFCLIQGAVRLIDGLLFVVQPMVLAAESTYGVVSMLVGLWLLSTRWTELRASGSGRLAAAATAGLFVVLAADTLGRNATAGVPALLFAWVMAIEARYAIAAGH